MRLHLERSGPWIGVAGLVCMLWIYGASGLLAPAWAVVALLLLWLVQLVLALRWFNRRPYVVLVMPLVAAAIWFGVIMAGDVFLGWTA